MRKRAVFFMLAALLLITGMASANSIQFDLIPQSGIILGDKVFSDFSLVGPISQSNVFVTTYIANGVYYIEFNGAFAAQNGGDNDYSLKYSVAATGGNTISMIDQAFNLTGAGNGGTVAIGETVRKESFVGEAVAQSSLSWFRGVGDFEDPPGELIQGDNLIINPALVKVWVTKDIFVDSAEDGLIGATIITQSFHQQVPEPMTLLLLGLGLFGLGIIRKLKK